MADTKNPRRAGTLSQTGPFPAAEQAADRTGTKKPAKSDVTRMRIIDAFLDLMQEKKWDRITVKELTGRIGATRGTFYQYFSDIYDLMEQLQDSLLTELSARYARIDVRRETFPIEKFIDRYDYSPPQSFLVWLDFCRERQKPMLALLDRQHGDTYFVKKLRTIMEEQINLIMDNDGLPRDELRGHFVRINTELHFLSVQTWLSTDKDQVVLSTDEIVNLLNTMRVGANYLTYRRLTDPNYDKIMGKHTPSDTSQ